ncbi:MAG: hypothetical protein LUH10_07310 [Tannerellaceae bacterium]|nr:hypothetical protein [Tannerellaceae bacterium]MCD8042858.1 hypothetical protein [Tannerellaceae bacterium]
MKKIVSVLLFALLYACDNRVYLIEPYEEEREDIPEKTNPPVIQVDTSAVIITDTIQVSF